MKKSITSLALLMSTAPAYAFVGPHPGGHLAVPAAAAPEVRTYCLSERVVNADGSVEVDTCDETQKNHFFKREIKENGCAEGQVAFKSASVKIKSCISPAQL